MSLPDLTGPLGVIRTRDREAAAIRRVTRGDERRAQLLERELEQLREHEDETGETSERSTPRAEL